MVEPGIPVDFVEMLFSSDDCDPSDQGINLCEVNMSPFNLAGIYHVGNGWVHHNNSDKKQAILNSLRNCEGIYVLQRGYVPHGFECKTCHENTNRVNLPAKIPLPHLDNWGILRIREEIFFMKVKMALQKSICGNVEMITVENRSKGIIGEQVVYSPDLRLVLTSLRIPVTVTQEEVISSLFFTFQKLVRTKNEILKRATLNIQGF